MANAVGTLLGVSPHYFQTSDSDATKITIYAGRAGTAACTSSTSTCDTCTGLVLSSSAAVGVFPVCNTVSINPNLIFMVNFKVADAASLTSSPAVKIYNSTTAIPTATGTTSMTTAEAPGRQLTAAVTWAEICKAFSSGADGTCSTSFSGTLKVGVENSSSGTLAESVNISINFRYLDPTVSATTNGFHTDCDSTTTTTAQPNEGICGFTVLPGDEKVFLSDVKKPTTFPKPLGTGTTVNFWGVRFFYSPTSESSPTNSVIIPGNGITQSADIQISADGSMSPTKIKDLQNDVTYVFNIATIDFGGNVAFFTDQDIAVGQFHKAKPSKVFGLLDKKKCFVATAAFGSEMDPRIQIFRNFRDQILMENTFGRNFVAWYYTNGPSLAKFIAGSNELRTVTRWVLWPLLIFAELSLKIGALAALTTALIAFAVMVLLFRRLREQMHRRFS